MKALSIQQPWAYFIVAGVKPVENRTWRTSYRGPLLIHAGKRFDRAGWEWITENTGLLGLDISSLPDQFDRGGIVGKVTVTGCVERHASPWFFGPYGFVMEDAERLEFRALRGQLGLFEVRL